MTFDNLIKYLSGTVHGLPEDVKHEAACVIEMLNNAQGYLTKEKPVRIIFFDDNAGK